MGGYSKSSSVPWAQYNTEIGVHKDTDKISGTLKDKNSENNCRKYELFVHSV
jgi:hypothetical protein